MTMIDSNLQGVRARIVRACLAAGRAPDAVALLAVSKTFGAGAVREAALAGQRRFGENYIQEAVEKMAQVAALGLPQPLEWHCIGPVQSNKTRQVAEHFDWMHTLDRLKTAQRLSDQRPAHLPPLQVCIQVNIDGGSTKSGVAPGEALQLARAVAQLPRLRLRGLMSIPDEAPDREVQLAAHLRVRQLFDALREQGGAGFEAFDTLSLGMTGDLEAAVAAGSTLVRVGSGIFGARQYGARPA